MGNGIAHVFALYGFQVVLTDIKEDILEQAVNTIKNNLGRQVKKETITEEQAEQALNCIRISTDMNSQENVDLLIEAVSENFGLKQKIFKELDRICKKDTVIASNTSSISITKLAAATNRADQVIGIHFMNPVPVMLSGFCFQSYFNAVNKRSHLLFNGRCCG